ncbi:unnamed protein product [Rotaria sp. Silwood2]|nr:unnamed protein product [Rotaria sp. Silwood2]
MSTRRTTEGKVSIVRLFSKFDNAHEVHRQWQYHFDTSPPDTHTVLSTNRKFDETGTVEDLPRSGRPVSILSEEKLEEIEEMVNDNPRLSIREGAARAGISKSSYQIAMTQLNFRPYHPTLIVDLNEDDFDRRSEFCEIWLDKVENDPGLIDRIFWSDEAKFRITVWCGMSSNGLVGPYVFDDTVTGSLYKEMLVEYVWPKLKRKKFYFQHDGAGAHYAIAVREWLDEIFSDHWIGRRGPFDWPARSPDLTPCDFFLWGYLKDIVFKKPPATLMELQQSIEEACEQVTEEMCRKACRSVMQRLRDCLHREGHFLSY